MGDSHISGKKYWKISRVVEVITSENVRPFHSLLFILNTKGTYAYRNTRVCIGLGLSKNANQLFLTQTLVKTKQAWKGRSFFSENYFASILLCSTKFCQAFFWHLKKMILQRWTTLKTHLSLSSSLYNFEFSW